MNDFLKECVEKVFTDENLNILWLNKQSKQDIIKLEIDLPIRYKLNEKGTRNIELMLQSQFGFYYKTIALIENTNILFPRQFDALTNHIDFKGFKKYGIKSEINVMIGAFSIVSLSYAIKNKDVDEYTSNDGKLEMVKAFDGTMQTFVKTKNNFAISSFSLTNGLYSSELDEKPISSFNFTSGNSGVYPTNHTHKWLEKLVPQRLLEIFTLEK